ncbi:hypothetical protein GCM10010415_30620 [Streptomyces atrovirens]|uniref:Transmembrane protein n=1 Tax=Streptomyces atrovirens TaxID=285556 RepID=A0ABW0DXH3_9ACTN
MTLGKLCALLVAPLMLIVGFGASFAGAFALIAGLLAGSEDGPPTCDGKVMRPGDQCMVSINGQRSSAGYDEMIRRREDTPRNSLILGSSCLGGGVVLLLGGWGIVRRMGSSDNW